jgi:hypothetical protein
MYIIPNLWWFCLFLKQKLDFGSHLNERKSWISDHGIILLVVIRQSYLLVLEYQNEKDKTFPNTRWDEVLHMQGYFKPWSSHKQIPDRIWAPHEPVTSYSQPNSASWEVHRTAMKTLTLRWCHCGHFFRSRLHHEHTSAWGPLMTILEITMRLPPYTLQFHLLILPLRKGAIQTRKA